MTTNLKKYITGVTALTSLTATSQANIVYWNPADTAFTLGQNASFDMLSGIVTLSGPATASAFLVLNFDTNNVDLEATSSLSDAVIGGDQMSRLTAGYAIDGSQAFSGGNYTFFDFENSTDYLWNTDLDGTNGFLGLRFAIAGQTHYAWAQFTYNDISNNIILRDFAYEDTANTTILAGAGAIPEPSSLLLLASGAVLAARRRRKAA